MVRTRHTARSLHWVAVAVALALAVLVAGVMGPAAAFGAEPLLPNIVADPPVEHPPLETSSNEGGLGGSGEAKLLLRFNGYLHNVGPGALDFRGSRKSSGEPMHAFQRVYNSDGSFKEEPSSAELEYVKADGHEHFHLQRAASYSLWNASRTAQAAPALKVGFCLDDSEHVEPSIGPKEGVYTDAKDRKFCRQKEPEALSLFEGVSIGWRDRYEWNLAYQWVDASYVLPGEYWLREDVNPTGVIKETGGAKTPGYSTKATIIPGFDALEQVVSRPSGEPVTITLTSKAWNDTATPKYKIESSPSHGTLSGLNGNQVTYTPAAGYSGPDSFKFSASDPKSEFPKSPAVAPVGIAVKPLLAGDSTPTYSVPDHTAWGHEEAFQFTAKAWGTAEELWFRTNGVPNTGITGLGLGVFADNAGKPGELLGTGTVSGEPETNSWIMARGLSVPVVNGTKYWLAALPFGEGSAQLNFNAAAPLLGGTGNLESVKGRLTELTPESSWTTFNQGPVDFLALGNIGQASVAISGAPSSMIAGTSVQLSALVMNDSPGVTWGASGGTVTAEGLYTAPSAPPAGGTVVITAKSSKGGLGQASITILPIPTPEPLPAAATSTATTGGGTTTPGASPGSGTLGASTTLPPVIFRPEAILVGRRLVMTTRVSRAGKARLTAYLGRHRLGTCAVQTPAGRSFTCRLTLEKGIRLNARISILASLRVGSTLFNSLRPAAPVPRMNMNGTGGLGARAAGVSSPQFWCSISMLEAP
jgi:Bacterial Ig domain/Lysyl oxidase